MGNGIYQQVNKTAGENAQSPSAQTVGGYIDSIHSSLGASNAVIVGMIVLVKDIADSVFGTQPENDIEVGKAYPSGRIFNVQSAQDEQYRLLDELRTQIDRLAVI